MAVHGELRIEPRGGIGFPWGDLVHDGRSIATVGRFSALRVLLGRGQPIRFEDGRRWRLAAVRWYRFVCPLIVDDQGRRLATSAPGVGADYAITCRDEAFRLIPAEDRPGRPRRWQLLALDEPVADVRRHPFVAAVYEPAPLPAVLLAWGLATIGVMGEKELVQQMGWTGPIGH